MKIALTGASGFIANSIQSKINLNDVEFVSLNRNETNNIWRQKISECQVVINLAGSPVIQRWTAKNKQTILDSRISTTRRLVTLLNELKSGPELLISASAIGIYPDKGEKVMTEIDYETGDGFLSEVVQQWEQEAMQLTNRNTRLAIMRIGVVLGKEGGLLKQTLPLFKLGLGGKIASGNQALSFIHIDDLVAAVQFFIEKKEAQGIYNMVAPHLTTNAEFTRVLAKTLKRPAPFFVPAFALKMLYGKAAQIMINGEKVYPEHLLNEGFVFRFPEIDAALNNLLKQ